MCPILWYILVMHTYLDIDRRFTLLPHYTPQDLLISEVGGNRMRWPQILENRFVIILAPANYGKTTEMCEQVKRMRQKGENAVFLELRQVANRKTFDKALEPAERHAYSAWTKSPKNTLTLFVDSLDEASATERNGIANLIGDVTAEIGWPNGQIRWVISTRPAVLSATVIETLSSQLIFPYDKTSNPKTHKTISSSEGLTSSSTISNLTTEQESLKIFRMSPLDSSQANSLLFELYPHVQAQDLLHIANARGLAGFTTSPGGLAVLANMGLTTNPPESLTDVFQRVVSAVQDRQRNDSRIEDAGGEKPRTLTEAAQKIASASQVCLLPNIDLTEDILSVTEGVLSARKIVSDLLSEKVLTQLLNSELFIDSALNQVKLYPDEISPFLGAQRLASLVQSPQQAQKLIENFSWKAPTGEQGVYKQYLPLLGWLATLNSFCREELLVIEPQAIAFFGDLRNGQIPLNAAKSALRESIRRLVELGDNLGRGMFQLTSENYWQAGPSRLSSFIKQLFQEFGNHHLARNALLKIAAASHSDVLRTAVLRENQNNYTKILENTTDLAYLLDAGNQRDLLGLANSLKSNKLISENVVATVISRLGWNYFGANEIANLVEIQFLNARSGFNVSYALDTKIVPDATDEQLYKLCRSLIVRLARTLKFKSRSSQSLSRFIDRYFEVTCETLAALVRRLDFSMPKRSSLLCLIIHRVINDSHPGANGSAVLRQAIQENNKVRIELISAEIRHSLSDENKLWSAIYGYGSLCSPTVTDLEVLNSPELDALVRNNAALSSRQRTSSPIREQRLKLSKTVKKELLQMEGSLRDGTQINGLAWIASWLLQTNPNSRYGEVNFEIFEKEAGTKISQSVKEGLSKLWRNRPPDFNEANPGSTYHITAAGLQGLHLELKDGSNLPHLSKDEIKSAIQYALFEINGYPKWFWPLIEQNQNIAGQELIKTVKKAKAGAVSFNNAKELLAAITSAPIDIQKKLAPLAWKFLLEQSSVEDYFFERILTAVTTIPKVVLKTDFEKTANSKINTAFSSALSIEQINTHSIQTLRKQSIIWATIWLSSYPAAFCKVVCKWSKSESLNFHDFIYALATHLGTDHSTRTLQLAKGEAEGVDALGMLYQWTIEVIRYDNDAVHPEGEAYFVGEREHAEYFRDALIPAIASAKSERAYEVLEMLRRSSSGSREIYLRSVQFQMRENQFSRSPIAQQNYNAFEENFRGQITDTISFAMKVHSDLLAVKYDIEYGEYSLRRFFTKVAFKKRYNTVEEGDRETLALEADFQCLLASELHHHSDGLYSVTVEPHTAESNRRDVLCSKGEMFASIELKMSRRWTLEMYEKTLEDQLVGQYMRHSKATTGFLVIVLQEPNRKWKDSNTRETFNFNQLIDRLSQKALQLMSKNRNRYLRVIGIDATEPENFRNTSKTKKTTKTIST